MSNNIRVISPIEHHISAQNRILRAAVVDMVDPIKVDPIDINGDGQSDAGISHSLLVKKILHRICPQAEITPFEINLLSTNPMDSNGDLAESALNEWCNKSLEIAEKLRLIKGSNIRGSTFHVVNVSVSTEESLGRLAEITGLPLMRDNVHEHRKKIIDKLRASSDPAGKNWLTVIEAIEEVIGTGSKVFISGSDNGGIDSFNLLLLAEGVIGVGATDAKGNIENYSPQNSLIQEYKQGTYSITEVFDGNRLVGYAIVQDGIVDIPVELTSNGLPIVKQYRGQRAESIVENDASDFKFGKLYKRSDVLNIMRESVNRVLEELKKDLKIDDGGNVSFLNNPSDAVQQIIARIACDYLRKTLSAPLIQLESSNNPYVVSLAPGTESEQLFGDCYLMDNNSFGNLQYDPDGSGRQAIAVLRGASFASPRAAGEYLNKEYRV